MNELNFLDRFSSTEDVRANLKRKSTRGDVCMVSGNAADMFVISGSIAVVARFLLPDSN